MRASTVAALLREYGQEREFVRQLAFNVALGNTDAHAKNYSVFLSGSRAELAPLYDSAPEFFFHDRYTDRLGMSIGGATRLGEVTERRWRRFAAVAGLDGDDVYREVHDVTRKVIERLPECLAQHGITDSSRQRLIQKHVRRINTVIPPERSNIAGICPGATEAPLRQNNPLNSPGPGTTGSDLS